MNNGRKKTYAGLDIGKFVCAFFILFYHYFSEHGPLPGILDEVLSLYAVAVALFMAISGFLLFDKLETMDDEKARWEMVKKQAIRIYRIYLIWSIPYLIFTISRWDWNTISLEFLFWQFQGWIFKSTFYTIWFMPMLAIGLILTFWITENLPDWLVSFLAFLMYIIGSLMLTYSYFGNMIPRFTIFANFANTWLGGARGWLFYAFPLIILGRKVGQYKDKVRWPAMLVLFCVCMSLMLAEALILRRITRGHTGIDMTIMMIPSVFCILGFLISVNIPAGAYCVWMRKMSILIFMSQRLFLTVLPYYFSDFLKQYVLTNNYVGGFFTISLTVTFSAIVIHSCKQFPILKTLC